MSLSYSPGLGIVYLLLLVLFAWGAGALATHRVRDWQNGLERAVFSVTLGMGFLGLALLVIGLLGFLQPMLLKGLLIGGALIGTGLIVAFGRSPATLRPKAAPGERDLLGLVSALALGVLGLCTLLGACAPPSGMEWDALSYHLADPKVYLSEGRIFYIPYEHHSNFPFQIQMLYLLMLGAGSVAGAKLCHWLCGALLVAAVYTFAQRHIAPAETGRRVGLFAALLVASTPIVLWESVIAYADLATALFVWLSLYALFNAAKVVALSEPSPPPPQRGGGGRGERASSILWLVLSALLMGFGLGTKMTVLGFWGLSLGGILGWHYATTRRWAKETIPHALLWAAISLAVGAPWYLKTFLYTGNPVYPFFFNLFGGRYWNAENALQYSGDQATLGMGKDPIGLLLAPWQSMVVPSAAKFNEYGFTFAPALIALLVAAPFVRRRFSQATVQLALFSIAFYVFWFFMMQQARYIIPVLPALGIIAGEALVGLWEERRSIARWFGAALTAASVLWGLIVSATNFAQPAMPVLTGRVSVPEYVAQTPFMGGQMPAIEYINRNAPADAKVALFDAVFGFYLDREYIWATPNHAAGLLPWDEYAGVDEWLADFKRRGYTYLLVNERGAPKPEDPLANQRWRSLLPEALASDKVTPEFSEKGVTVYRIR